MLTNTNVTASQWANDELTVRNASNFLLDQVIPAFHENITKKTISMPYDGKMLTEMMHENGINMRYLGVLAKMAETEEEMREMKEQQIQNLPRFWRSLLETEIVARTAKHVLDRHMRTRKVNGTMSEKIIALLNALVCVGEETAREEEVRLKKGEGEGASATGSFLASAKKDQNPRLSYADIWEEINSEITKRFPSYKVQFYGPSANKELAERALLIPLLRRVCQRSGLRLAGRVYELQNAKVKERSERALRKTRVRATTKLTLFSIFWLARLPPASIKNAPRFARRSTRTTASPAFPFRPVIWLRSFR